MKDLDEVMQKIKRQPGQEPPYFQFEDDPYPVVKKDHFERLNQRPRVAWVQRHSYIREDQEHDRDIEYVILPRTCLEQVIQLALVGERMSVQTHGKKIIHQEHTCYGERQSGSPQETHDVLVTIKACQEGDQVKIDLHYK